MADLIHFNLPKLNQYESKELKSLRNYLALLTKQVEYHLNHIDEDNYTAQYNEKINALAENDNDSEEAIKLLRGNINQLMQSAGWQDVPINSTSFAHYDSSQRLEYMRYGNLVEIRGAAKPTANLDLSNNETSFTIGTLPSDCRPTNSITLLCHGSGLNIWRCRIMTDGSIRISRYRNSNTLAQQIPSGAWLPIHTTFFID